RLSRGPRWAGGLHPGVGMRYSSVNRFTCLGGRSRSCRARESPSSPMSGPRGGSAPRKEPMEDLRIGVVGFGARATLARHAHMPGEGSRVTVVADPSQRGRDLARERLGEDVATVESVQELLAGHEVDAVMILAPDFAHASVALQTLEAGIPTFC